MLYGISTYVWLIFVGNVGKYTITWVLWVFEWCIFSTVHFSEKVWEFVHHYNIFKCTNHMSPTLFTGICHFTLSTFLLLNIKNIHVTKYICMFLRTKRKSKQASPFKWLPSPQKNIPTVPCEKTSWKKNLENVRPQSTPSQPPKRRLLALAPWNQMVKLRRKLHPLKTITWWGDSTHASFPFSTLWFWGFWGSKKSSSFSSYYTSSIIIPGALTIAPVPSNSGSPWKLCDEITGRLHPGRLTAGTCPHRGLVQIIFLSKWVMAVCSSR